MNSGFRPVVLSPSHWKLQTKSNALQTPFFFGGSQVPTDLHLRPDVYNGSSGGGFSEKPKMKPAIINRVVDIRKPIIPLKK